MLLDYEHPDASAWPLIRRRVRTAVMLLAIVPAVLLTVFIADGVSRRQYAGSMGGFFVISAIGMTVALSAAVVALLLFLPRALQLGSRLVRHLTARHISVESWDVQTAEACASLPWAAAAAGLTLGAYVAGNFGGWPDDVIFGTLAWIIAVWPTLTFVRHWRRAGRRGVIEIVPGITPRESS